MTTVEENEALTRVGPDMPAGRMLRRYWWPIGISSHVKTKPTLVRLLGEDLVLFRSGAGMLGLIGARCAHRCANLAYGTVDADGLRCRYHGWKYACDGTVLDIPGNAHSDEIAQGIHQLAYPVVEQGGLIFAYLGPAPKPLLPQYDFVVGLGDRIPEISGFSDSNWLQCVENGMDPQHVTFLHGESAPRYGDHPTEWGFVDTEYGMFHKTVRPGQKEGTVLYREHHVVMPGISITGAAQRRILGGDGPSAVSARWTVPVSDERTMTVSLFFKPAENTGRIKDDVTSGIYTRWEAVKVEPYKEYLSGTPESVGYSMPEIIPCQDATILDSMGPISPRERENLVRGDEGIVRIRRLYLRAIADVAAGQDPVGVFRTPGVVRVNAHESYTTRELIPA